MQHLEPKIVAEDAGGQHGERAYNTYKAVCIRSSFGKQRTPLSNLRTNYNTNKQKTAVSRIVVSVDLIPD